MAFSYSLSIDQSHISGLSCLIYSLRENIMGPYMNGQVTTQTTVVKNVLWNRIGRRTLFIEPKMWRQSGFVACAGSILTFPYGSRVGQLSASIFNSLQIFYVLWGGTRGKEAFSVRAKDKVWPAYSKQAVRVDHSENMQTWRCMYLYRPLSHSSHLTQPSPWYREVIKAV